MEEILENQLRDKGKKTNNKFLEQKYTKYDKLKTSNIVRDDERIDILLKGEYIM
jgi:hypothetical protein